MDVAQVYVCYRCKASKVVYASSCQDYPGLFKSELPKEITCGYKGCTGTAVKVGKDVPGL